MKEDIDLNLLDVLSAKQGKQAWSLNQTDTEEGCPGFQGGKRKTNACLPMYTEGEGISHNLTRTSPPTARTTRSFSALQLS